MAAQKTVAWRVGAIVLLIAGFSLVGHFTTEAESGVVQKLTSTQVCIHRGAPNGRNVGCWRVDPNTDIDPGLHQGSLVTVRHHGDLARSVTE